ncbi:MAG: hypothetical protein AAF975_05835 [Spirochaetota bacterium]
MDFSANISAQNNQNGRENALHNGGEGGSEERDFSLEAAVNWEQQQLQIELSVPIRKLELQTRYYVNRVIESNFSVWLYDSVKNLPINSQQTFKDFWGSDVFKSPYDFLEAILKKKYAVFDPDFKSFRAVYEVNLYPDLVKIWVNDSFRGASLPAAILSQDATEFSGLIIYVEDALPIRGESYQMAKLKPAIFPRIYDENLNLLVNHHHIHKEVLLERGMLRYDLKSNADKHRELVGALPLRIVARELFGKHPTDIIISKSDADSLLENIHARKALREGRILVLYESDPQSELYLGEK